MTATPNFASGALAGAESGAALAPAAVSPGPFVLNLCSSSTPMALAQTDLPQLKRFTFFVSRRFEEGRERFRLHMGYFATLAEAEEWLSVVREIYPGAWAGEAPGRKLRERAAAAAAAQAQHAAGPQPHAPPAPAARSSVPVPAAATPASRPVARAPGAKPGASAPRPAAPAVKATTPAPAPASARAGAAGKPVAPSAAQPPAKPAVKPVFEDSNVREVLKALGDSSLTGETRLMHAPPPPPPPPREAPADGSSLSDTQVLRMLEARRPEGGEPPPAEAAAGGIPLLKPDDTGTRRALKDAVTANAPVAFAVQLQWAVQPVELDKVPPLAIFSAYTLYTVEGSRDGRKWYGLRLGFFSDAISAKQVAHYVRSEFASVAVVPVSPQEKARATDQEQAATLAAPVAARFGRSDEFKLIEDTDTAPAVPAPAPPRATRAASTDRPLPRVAVGRSVRQSTAAPREGARGGSRVGARDKRGPQTLEETLEILGAGELSLDTGTGERLNDSGVRHLRVEVQKNSPFARLLERLSERVKKP